MKNTRIYPFERNKYFYGKLLTVRDFESEQKYFNDKRRMLNRLVYGAGVLCGLQVVDLGEKSIMVKSGAALDYSGREIVISQPVTLNLSTIEGFSNNDYVKNVYLCLVYDEQEKEKVHTIAGPTDNHMEVPEHNRIQESYRLFIRERALDVNHLNDASLFESRLMLYQDEKLRVMLIVPQYTLTGDLINVRVRIEKVLQTEKLEVAFKAELKGFSTLENQNVFSFAFAEKMDSRESVYEKSFQIKTTALAGEKAKITLDSKDVKLKTGDTIYTVPDSTGCSIKVLNESLHEEIFDKYYAKTLEKCLQDNSEQLICLAEISLLHVNSTFEIKKIKQVPYNQYVYNPSLEKCLEGIKSVAAKESSSGIETARASLKHLESSQQPHVEVLYEKEKKSIDFEFGIPLPEDRFSSGIVEIKFGDQAKSKEVFYSDEIEHKLGAGNVFLSYGLLDNDEYVFNEAVFIGDFSLFNQHAKIPEVSIGAVLYPQKGTFKLGFRLNRAARNTSVFVKWWACKI
ncbi:MAG: hypothetical protein N2645_06135 [Clostridia bacterium]|nr:hypothetical protein [Clostridia bacterium]